MCAITGILGKPGDASIRHAVRAMTACLVHRGPDGGGEWHDESVAIGLGHRRLAILDLSAEGHQPMASVCGRFVIVFNGEIYNHADLRLELGSQFAPRGHSDTEVMLAAIVAWGLERALSKFVGMFAFALWDRHLRELHLVRDRAGEKPLYYGIVDGRFVFASELKALVVCAGSRLKIDLNALQSLTRYGYIPSPLSIYEGISKLTPGGRMCVRVDGEGNRHSTPVQTYWSLDSAVSAARRAEHSKAGDAELEAEFHSLLTRAIRGQMVADVPLGAFLSGGVDSSTVVAVLQQESARPVRTFTIGFSEAAYNEAHFAKRVAQHLGTVHTELYVSPSDAAAVIPKLPQMFDEPFADSSQVPTYLVARMTREHVTVSLSGDGGDELFGGYDRYGIGEQLWNRMNAFPRWTRALSAAGIAAINPVAWNRLLALVLSRGKQAHINGHRLHRLSRVLKADTLLEMYSEMVSQWQAADRLILGVDEGRALVTARGAGGKESALNQMRLFDVRQYLPDDILVKVDRACMSVSLESRAPLLDHRVMEFAWSLPQRALVRAGQRKWLLRRVLDRYVPRALIDRPKAGFQIPLDQWLRTDLREWAEDMLNEATLRRQGFFAVDIVRRMWKEHLAGTHNRQAYLWSVLMFQAWLSAQDAGNSFHGAQSLPSVA